MIVAAVAGALPEHYYDQATLLARLEKVWNQKHHNPDRLRRLHQNVLVGGRHLALEIDRYEALNTFGERNDAWIKEAQNLGARAVTSVLERSGLEAKDVDCLLFVSVTGLAVPSIDARLIHRLGMRPDVVRLPLFGLGCVAGTAGVARAADWVRAYPDKVALLLSVELCSLTLLREDLSVPNLIATGLFGDGAAAVLLVGEEHPHAARLAGAGCRVKAQTRSLYQDTTKVMGWQISEQGFRVVLSADVPKIVEQHLCGDVEAFLASVGKSLGDIQVYVSHPGGPRVLEAIERSLVLPDAALERTWRSLREVGNLSSTSVLLVLEETLSDPPPLGTLGLMLAMGPGFCSELVLLEF